MPQPISVLKRAASVSSGATATSFDWVNPEQSLQWSAFQRALAELKSRHNELLVIIGPFNEHMINAESKPGFLKLRDVVVAHLQSAQIPFVKPEVLPSEVYADASHPLTAGYQTLAERILKEPVFQNWLSK